MQGKRIVELDYLRALCILLMVAFHLVFIGRTYPVAKQVVYTFHMPVFLIISGYLARVPKEGGSHGRFLRAMLWIAVPYALVESAYVVAASLLPVYEHVDHLSPLVLACKVVLHPIGPYWYLHTLLLCSLAYYGVMLLRGMPMLFRLVLLAVVYWFLSRVCGIMVLANAMYFLFGALLRLSGMGFLRFFPSRWWMVPVLLCVVLPPLLSELAHCRLVESGVWTFSKSSLGGIAMVWSVTGVMLWSFRLLSQRVASPLLFIGSNTLPLLLFSPLFTILAKTWQPWLLAVDGSGMVFMVVSVAVAVVGSLALGALSDRLGLSRYFFGGKVLRFPQEKSGNRA